MPLKKFLLIALILLSGLSKAGEFPLKISEIQRQNAITNYQGQKLILVDFWATWCGPCRAATTQLEILQEQLKNEVFIISMTDETHETIEKHLKNHPPKLLVARDIGGNIFRKYKVYTRPYAILFNTKGEILWKGHPSELNYNKIKIFYRKNIKVKETRKIEEILSVDTFEKESTEDNRKVKLTVEKINDSNALFAKDNYKVNYYGTISNLIAQLKRVPKHFVETNTENNFFVHLESPIETWNKHPEDVLKLLKRRFNINITPKTSLEEVFEIKVVDASKLWNMNQIDWGEDNIYNYLRGEDRVQADNLSISEFCLVLSDIKNKTYQYNGENKTLYDWDVHFLFDDLMNNELIDQFGIKPEPKMLKVTRFKLE